MQNTWGKQRDGTYNPNAQTTTYPACFEPQGDIHHCPAVLCPPAGLALRHTANTVRRLLNSSSSCSSSNSTTAATAGANLMLLLLLFVVVVWVAMVAACCCYWRQGSCCCCNVWAGLNVPSQCNWGHRKGLQTAHHSRQARQHSSTIMRSTAIQTTAAWCFDSMTELQSSLPLLLQQSLHRPCPNCWVVSQVRSVCCCWLQFAAPSLTHSPPPPKAPLNQCPCVYPISSVPCY